MSTGLIGRAWSAISVADPGQLEGVSREILLDPPRAFVESTARRDAVPAARCVHRYVVERTQSGVLVSANREGAEGPRASIAICGAGEPAGIASAAARRFFEGRPGECAVGVTVVQSALI